MNCTSAVMAKNGEKQLLPVHLITPKRHRLLNLHHVRHAMLNYRLCLLLKEINQPLQQNWKFFLQNKFQIKYIINVDGMHKTKAPSTFFVFQIQSKTKKLSISFFFVLFQNKITGFLYTFVELIVIPCINKHTTPQDFYCSQALYAVCHRRFMHIAYDNSPTKMGCPTVLFYLFIKTNKA